MFLRQFTSALFASIVMSACSAGATQSTAALNAGHSDNIGRFLDPAAVPGRVKKAVDEVTRLGREEADFFGFQRFEAYDLVDSAAEPRLKKIVADVIEASRQHGDYSLAQFCQEGYDSEGRVLGFDEDNECALYLIGYHKQPRYRGVFDELRNWHSAHSDESTRMNSALNNIQSFIGNMVGGDDLEEISISLNGLNVSEETIVLINKTKGHVVILKYDYGA